MRPPRPPRLAARLLDALLPAGSRDELLGDLHELFVDETSALGRTRARIHYWREALLLVIRLRVTHGRRLATPSPAGLRDDVRSALRSARRAPLATIAALATMSAGFAGATAIFSLADPLLIRPLALPHSEQLVSIKHTAPDRSVQLSAPEVEDLRTSGAFNAVSGYTSSTRVLTQVGPADRVMVAEVDASFFTVLQVSPVAGRVFDASDFTAAGPRQAIVSEGFARGRLGGTEAAVGRVLALNDEPFTVAGVVPSSASAYPEGTQIWLPQRLRAMFRGRGMHMLEVLARTSHVGETLQTVVATLGDRLAAASPGAHKDIRLVAVRIQDEMVRSVRPVIRLLMIAAAALVLVACTNVAALLMMRLTQRTHELAIRVALGAGQARLMRLLTVESLLLAGAGAIAGILFAVPTLAVLVALSPAELPRQGEVGVDSRALAFAGLLALASGCLAAAGPVLLARRIDGRIRQDARMTAGKAAQRARGALVIAQLATACCVLVSAALLGRSLHELSRVDMGFEAASVIRLKVALPLRKYDEVEAQTRFFAPLEERLKRHPDVAAAGIGWSVPLGGVRFPARLRAPPQADPPADAPNAEFNFVSAGYFEALRIPVLRGRTFSAADQRHSLPVAIVSESLERRLWPGGSAVGQTVEDLESNQGVFTIVGVARDVHQAGAASPAAAMIYRPTSQFFSGIADVLVRTRTSPSDFASTLAAVVHDLDPDVPAGHVETMEKVVASATARTRFTAFLVGMFAVTAALLALVGVYALVGHSASSRRREYSLRMALGARPWDLGRTILWQGSRLALGGGAVGVVVSLATGDLLRALLFGVNVRDPVTLVGIPALLATAVLAACFVPARRVMRLDPAAVLRDDTGT